MSLINILERHTSTDGLGIETSNALVADLEQHKKFNTAVYLSSFIFIVVALAIGLVAIVADLVKGSGTRIALLSAAGLSAPIMFEIMRRAVREWTQTDLLLTLIKHSDPEDVQRLTRKLIQAKMG